MLSDLARAKINLYLHVTGKTAHNYHALDSLAVFADIGDRVTVSPSSSLDLVITGNGDHLPANDENSVLQAAQKLQAQYSIQTGAAITLEKYLPVGAGIGGGSADAAATLRLLAKLWRVPNTDLHDLAFALGADVPVCLANTASYMHGSGEILEPVHALPAFSILLINNNQPLLTSTVFGQYAPPFSLPVPHPLTFITFSELVDFLRHTHNDLQKPAMALMPEINVMLEELQQDKHCALARMSGSGATCFGLFEHNHDAQALAKHIQQRYPSWWIAAGNIT